ncbi:MAG: IS5 family transposase [Thiotrichaceae bacterium]|nr:IS5 family transposase [Thiotrichaceae bacterium]
MAWKNLAQTDLSDALIQHHEALEELDGINELIDWTLIEAKLSAIHSKKRGEQAWPPLMMFKILLLQSWYSLSDPKLEKQLARDLMFRRFIDLSLSEGVPDHSTIWRFRNLLNKQSLLEPLLIEINEQLAEQDLFIKMGEISIIDATVIEANQSRPRKNKAGENTQDPEADYNVKVAANGKKTATYGYKAHINTDEDGFIKTVDYTAGNEHDSLSMEKLLTLKEKELYADKAYASKKHDQLLKEKGIVNRILHKGKRGHSLSVKQKDQNKQWSSIRSTVERVFGVLKLHYGIRKARYLGLERNKTSFMLTAMAYNIKRGANIKADMCL